MLAHSCFWLLLGAQIYSWLLIATNDCRACLGLLTASYGCPWPIMAAYWPSVAADGCVCLLVAATSWSCQLSLVHGLSIIVSGIRPLYVRSIARSWCQDCACHLTAVLYCCGVSSSCVKCDSSCLMKRQSVAAVCSCRGYSTACEV